MDDGDEYDNFDEYGATIPMDDALRIERLLLAGAKEAAIEELLKAFRDALQKATA